MDAGEERVLCDVAFGARGRWRDPAASGVKVEWIRGSSGEELKQMGEKMDDAKGRAKEAAGDLTGDRRLKREGKVDRASGGLKGAIEKIRQKLQGKR